MDARHCHNTLMPLTCLVLEIFHFFNFFSFHFCPCFPPFFYKPSNPTLPTHFSSASLTLPLLFQPPPRRPHILGQSIFECVSTKSNSRLYLYLFCGMKSAHSSSVRDEPFFPCNLSIVDVVSSSPS